jgi:hypothetical protein
MVVGAGLGNFVTLLTITLVQNPPSFIERRIMRNRVSREDDNEISSFHPKKPGFLTDVLDVPWHVSTLSIPLEKMAQIQAECGHGQI